MKQQTIKEAISDESKLQDADYRLYLIREGETVFYVGQSQNTHNRLLSHLGYDERYDPSPVGQLILENAPQSDSWLFEQYTLEECRGFACNYGVTTTPWFWQRDLRRRKDQYIVNMAEEALIIRYQPCLNVEMNPHPTLLPEYYQRVYYNPYAKKLSARFGFRRRSTR